jgi:hypothetical protein
MRILSTLFVFIISASLSGCMSGDQINARSLKAANRSVSRIKNRLPSELRIEYEVSYWTLRDSIRDKDTFLDTINGKTPEEIIGLGKEVFQQRKNSGFKGYVEYSNWDQMITQFVQKRIDQSRSSKATQNRPARNGSILYNL